MKKCRRNLFFFSKKIIIFGHSPTNLGPFVGFFRLSCQNCVLRVQKRVLRKNNFLRNYCFPFFQDCEQNVSAVFWEISVGKGLSKQYFTCRTKHFVENIFLNKVFWFSTFKEKIVAFSRKFFGPVVKTEFSLSLQKFWKISILCEKIHHFRTFCDKSSVFCQKK